VATLSDDDLILFFYEEHPDAKSVAEALAADPALERHYQTLVLDLGALAVLDAPEPRPGLEGRMWARIEPELARPRRSGFWVLGWPRVAFVAVAAVALLCAFLAGQSLRPTPTEQEVAKSLTALTPEARDRVLAAAVSDHLASSERLLMEVSNGAPSADDERRMAEALLGANRLYRRAAERAGQRRIAAILLEIEPLLVRLAESPTAPDLRLLRERIDDRDLLFKVRITRANLKEMS